MASYAKDLMRLFSGDERAHGTYDFSKAATNAAKKNKVEGTGYTRRSPATVELWEKHLAGDYSLGIIPIREDSTCSWGALDIDQYDLNLAKLAQDIDRYSLPLVPCRTKSGGAHLYLFVTEPVEAAVIKDQLELISSQLGFGGCEVYPKQTEVLVERGDIGNWLNMPYYGGETTDRYAFDSEGNALSIKEFFKLVEVRRVTPDKIEDIEVPSAANALDEGPPCLQHLIRQGFPEGTRNVGLFNLAVYLRKARPDTWKQELEKFNQEYMQPPLSAMEVLSAQKSVDKRSYEYTCKQQPIASFCSMGLCRTKKFGIGHDGSSNSQGSNFPTISGLSKLDSRPPIWFLDINGSRIQLDTEELQSQNLFQRVCMDELNVVTPSMNKAAWQNMISGLMSNVVVIEAPDDMSPQGQFWEMVEKFCTQKAQAKAKEEILLGKPWSENGWVYIRMIDLRAYLDRNRFRDYKVHEMGSLLKKYGGEHHRMTIKNRNVNLWKLPAFEMEGNEALDIPENMQDDDQVY